MAKPAQIALHYSMRRRGAYSVAIVLLSAGPVSCGRLNFEPTATLGDATTTDTPPDVATDGANGPAPNLAFVTAATFTGDLGGLAGADAACNAAAASAAGGPLPGTFRALMADSTTSIAARFGTARGWVDLQGRPIARGVDELSDRMLYPIDVDENRTRIDATQTEAWTGNNTLGPHYCSDWTTALAAETGGASRVGGPIVTTVTTSCNTPQHLFCAEFARTAIVTVPPSTARVAVVLSHTLSPLATMGDADGECQADAVANGLAGSFLAVQHRASAPVQSRLLDTNAPWRRVDNILLAPSGTALFNGSSLDTFINQMADGQPSNFLMPSMDATLANCNEWTSGTPNFTFRTLQMNTRHWHTPSAGSADIGCNLPFRILCLQR